MGKVGLYRQCHCYNMVDYIITAVDLVVVPIFDNDSKRKKIVIW